MATSSQRLIILTFMINFVLYIGAVIWAGVAFETTVIDREKEAIRQNSIFFNDEFAEEMPDTENFINPSSFGDEKGAQKSFWSILADGLKLIPVRDNDPIIEKIVIRGYDIFRGLMAVILTLEIYFIIFSKKNT